MASPLGQSFRHSNASSMRSRPRRRIAFETDSFLLKQKAMARCFPVCLPILDGVAVREISFQSPNSDAWKNFAPTAFLSRTFGTFCDRLTLNRCRQTLRLMKIG